MATKKKTIKAEDSEEIVPGRVKRLLITNFRAIGKKTVQIDLDKIVVLVGPNNAGKSSILRAYEAIMQDGSKDGHLKQEDFPDGKIDPKNLPTIELHTAITKHAPSSKWVANEDGESTVKERWTWNAPGVGRRQGWNVQTDSWDEDEVPWGATNVANSRRPQPHWVQAFDKPEEQAEKINKLVTTMVIDKAKQIPASDGSLKEDGVTPRTEFDVLLESLRGFQDKVFQQTKSDVETIESKLTEMVADVFTDHVVNFSLHPPEDNAIKLFSGGSSLSVGHKDGWKGPLQNQGSGARRTVLWSVLRVLSEQVSKSSERPRVLLIDEPELCLHPNAIREACRVLYDLAENAGWQVIVTTHSPAFIDLGRDNTTVVRVERAANGDIKGTTLFRPSTAKLGVDDRENLHLLNVYDPYVAEFFFGGRVIVVEGDTEYSAFRYLISMINNGKVDFSSPETLSNIQIIRARGKSTIVSLCKILNQFGAPYSILHDSDRPEIIKNGVVKTNKDGKPTQNPAWTINSNILTEVNNAPDPTKIRVLASKINFEHAFLGEEASDDKPYNAIRKLSDDTGRLKTLCELLLALIDHKNPIPKGVIDANTLKESDVK